MLRRPSRAPAIMVSEPSTSHWPAVSPALSRRLRSAGSTSTARTSPRVSAASACCTPTYCCLMCTTWLAFTASTSSRPGTLWLISTSPTGICRTSVLMA